MNLTTHQTYYFFGTDISSVHLFPIAIGLIILAIIIIQADQYLHEKMTLPVDCVSPEDKVHFIHKGDNFTMTVEQKDMFDQLLPIDKDLFCKDMKKRFKARAKNEAEIAAGLNKNSNKKEDRIKYL
jgi:hypothetical protein